jgi:hypothetical protein
MKHKPETKVSGVRLGVGHWQKLRELMQINKGRAWLERIIDREHKKLAAK